MNIEHVMEVYFRMLSMTKCSVQNSCPLHHIVMISYSIFNIRIHDCIPPSNVGVTLKSLSDVCEVYRDVKDV